MVLAGLVVALVTGCSTAPTAEELAGADAARAEGLRVLESVDIPLPSGVHQIAERRLDACGSTTSDRGGFDDRHIEGYSCAAVRRTVYAFDDATGSGRNDATDLPDDATATAAVAEIQNAFGLNLSPYAPTADGLVDIDGTRVRILALVRPAEEVDIDVLPLWHRNETVRDDDGPLKGAMDAAGVAASRVLQVTTTVYYFEVSRDTPDASG
ncbi:hypothetical protein ACH3VR_16205 [Microbacterium sp. B2969]|uniref:AMMECR1 domain-containing protein n=1 Tax=Microbacterium alkaliflavum TaxID=3248839 RepID=A0ABW7QET4_9MICO